eukprot:61945-Prymnesium_polylepis.1
MEVREAAVVQQKAVASTTRERTRLSAHRCIVDWASNEHLCSAPLADMMSHRSLCGTVQVVQSGCSKLRCSCGVEALDGQREQYLATANNVAQMARLRGME